MNSPSVVPSNAAMQRSSAANGAGAWDWPCSAWFSVLLLLTVFLVEWASNGPQRLAADTKAGRIEPGNETERQVEAPRRNRRLSLNFSRPTLPRLRPNSCAPYSMTIALHAIHNPIDYEQICEEVEFADEGVGFDRIIPCLERHARVTEHRRTSPNDLLSHLDSGNPALVVFYYENGTHLVTCIGYTTDRQGRVQQWEMIDSATWESGGNRRRHLSHEEFCRSAHRRHTDSDSAVCCRRAIDHWLAVSRRPKGPSILEKLYEGRPWIRSSPPPTSGKEVTILELLRESRSSSRSSPPPTSGKETSILEKLGMINDDH